MSINNKADWLAQWAAEGIILTDHPYFGSNRLVPPGAYARTSDSDGNLVAADSVTFVGTAGNDTLLGGGGEFAAIFLGTRGVDLYGGPLAREGADFGFGVVDYSAAPSRVVVDMGYQGSRTFTDETGETRTVSILGQALKDGYGGRDYFIEGADDWSGLSSVTDVIGSRFADNMKGFGFGLHGGAGNDRMAGNFLYGGDGNDVLRGDDGDGSVLLYGGAGNDCLYGTNSRDRLVGGAGNDRMFAGGGDDGWVTGEEGNDFIDGGDGNDFIDGGVGKDVLLSGAGNDTINPDVEFFQSNPTQPRDGDRDVIKVTRDDLGDYVDRVISRAFEAGVDEIRFREAVKGGVDYRVFYEAQSKTNTGSLPPSDLADLQNTVLQIDWNRDGFGEGEPDAADYFLVVTDATLTECGGWLLT